jgi:hypothetical protein
MCAREWHKTYIFLIKIDPMTNRHCHINIVKWELTICVCVYTYIYIYSVIKLTVCQVSTTEVDTWHYIKKIKNLKIKIF